MALYNFDEFFDMKGGSPTFLENEKAQEIEKWIRNDEDEPFLEFVRYVEDHFLENFREVYEDTIKCVVNLYEAVGSDPNAAKSVDEKSPIRYEIRRLWWKLCLYTDQYCDEDHNLAAREWLRICLNLNGNKDTEFYLELSGHDREAEVREILFRGGKQVSEFFRQGVGLSYLNLVLDWSLRRYNLALARKLACILMRKEPHRSLGERFVSAIKAIFPKRSGNLLVISAALCLLLLLCFSHLGPSIGGITEGYSSITIGWSRANAYTTLLFALYPAMLILLIGSFWRRAFLFFKLLMPRMVGGIVVGYMPLIIAEDAWNMVSRIDGREIFCIALFALGFSLYYLFIEVDNALRNKWLSLGRALRIFSTGLLESFIIGVVVSDLIARDFYPELMVDPLTLPGLFGYIYPKMLYLYFPLALFIGIFAQIIWEDKPITHPL